MNIFLWSGGVLLSLMLSGCDKPEQQSQKPKEKEVEVKSVSRTLYSRSMDDMKKAFDDINYSLGEWDENRREIPRIYLTDISSRWGEQSQRIPVKIKKSVFFRSILPLILHSNELILEDRTRLEHFIGAKIPSTDESAWVRDMATRYKLIKDETDIVDEKILSELLLRVDIIPASLALAQAAEESGWGTSRFALMGNSLFGQWDFSGRGMVPEAQRKELGDYGLAKFDTPLKAVQSYMLNLNTHRAYRRLRESRAKMLSEGKRISGHKLAETLDQYSERRYAYVESLQSMMEYNHLSACDDAYLWTKETIYLTPIRDPQDVVEKRMKALQDAARAERVRVAKATEKAKALAESNNTVDPTLSLSSDENASQRSGLAAPDQNTTVEKTLADEAVKVEENSTKESLSVFDPGSLDENASQRSGLAAPDHNTSVEKILADEAVKVEGNSTIESPPVDDRAPESVSIKEQVKIPVAQESSRIRWEWEDN